MKRMFDKEEIVEIAKEEGGSVTVDSELSPTSENPVQNKVIYEALADKQDSLPDTTGQTDKYLKVGSEGLEWAEAGGGTALYLHRFIFGQVKPTFTIGNDTLTISDTIEIYLASANKFSNIKALQEYLLGKNPNLDPSQQSVGLPISHGRVLVGNNYYDYTLLLPINPNSTSGALKLSYQVIRSENGVLTGTSGETTSSNSGINIAQSTYAIYNV